MAGRFYTVGLDHITLTTDADQDILMFANGAASAMLLHELRLTSSHTSDERLRLRLLRRTGAGSGGSAATENPLDELNTVTANCAVTYLVTAPGTGGAVLEADEWPQLTPWIWLPTPENRILVKAGGYLALHCGTAAGGSRSISVTAKWEEL